MCVVGPVCYIPHEIRLAALDIVRGSYFPCGIPNRLRGSPAAS